MKTIYKLIIAIYILSFFASCSDELLKHQDTVEEGIPTRIDLHFETGNAQSLSRATSPEKDEYKVNNLYVFIFNADESLASKQFFDYEHLNNKQEKGEGAAKTTGNVTLQTVSGSGKTIWAIANINNSMRDITKETLDGISNLTTLRQQTDSLQQETIARGTSFLMSGTTEDINGSPTTIDIPAGKFNLTIPIVLKRVDAKVTFNIKTKAGITFTPSEWKVVKASKTVSLLPGESDPETDTDDYFESSWAHYEGEGDNFGRTFSFYVAENRKKPRKEILPEENGQRLSREQMYAKRELQEKNNDLEHEGYVKNGAYVHANENSTYVVMKGNITYNVNASQKLSADVIYTIHLGYVNGANDFNTNRNTHYIYTVTINGAHNIEVEVDENKEIEPGTEGEVIVANNIITLDCHYGVEIINFQVDQISDQLTWYVKTVFSEGMAETNPQDFQWIKFRLNNLNDGYYHDNIRQAYPGPVTYTDEEIANLNYVIQNDKLVNVEQLVELLKANKRIYETSGNQRAGTLFDAGLNITFTAFIDENYYTHDPEGKVNSPYLWKYFVNQPERIMHILSRTKYSQDRESIKHTAVTSFIQKSIQTMYNVNIGDELQTAWGTECIQETDKRPFWNKEHQSDPDYTDPRNGLSNTRKLWQDASWSYVNSETGKMLDQYNYARYNCMLRNRDLNGNGTIDPDEVRWYLAAIDQLTDLWIGENSFDAEARLFKGSTWEEDWYVSSTVPDRYQLYSWNISPKVKSQWDNPTVLWSSEGSSIGPMRDVPGYITKTFKYFNTTYAQEHDLNKTFNYRCVRNLGTSPDSDNIPQDFAKYENGTISLKYLNEKSIRAYTQEAELPEHHERQADNLPWWNFKVNSTSSQLSTGPANWIEIRNAINRRQSPCPPGWRVPNQRELALMLSRVGNDEGWTLDQHMSRTRFSMNPQDQYRHGFSVTKQAGILFLINNSNEKGGVRCVKDINQ